MKEPTSRQKQAIETKLRITKAAMKLLKNTSYESIKITDICKEAHVSVGTFYHYFESKYSIIRSAYYSIDTLILEKFEQESFDSYIDAIIGLNKAEATIVASLGFNFTSNSYIQILMDESHYTLSPNRLVHLKLIKLLELALSNHEITSNNIYNLAEYINRTARGNIFDWCLKYGTTNLVEVWTSDITKIMLCIKYLGSNGETLDNLLI